MRGTGNNESTEMHKRFVIVIMTFIPVVLCGQFTEEQGLVSRYKPGLMWNFTGLRPAKGGKAHKYDRLIFDISYNDWLGDLQTFKNRWSSIGLNSNVLFDIPLNESNTISLGTGIRHTLFRTENLTNLFVPDPTHTYTTVSDAVYGESIKRRLICGNSIGVPLELRFRSRGWKHMKFQIGGTIAYQLNMYSKTVYDDEYGKQIEKDYNFVDLNRVAFAAHVRLGVRNWGIYTSCGLNQLFSNRSSTKLHLFQLGLSVSLF
jgi:hypothetical protein